MANSYKLLFQGQLPSSVGTLFTVPAVKQWIVKNVTIVNNDTSAHTFILYQNGTTAPFAITSTAINIPLGGSWVDDETHTLNSADFWAGNASVASQLTMNVWGDEVS